MDYSKRWFIIESLQAGGQAEAHIVVDLNKCRGVTFPQDRSNPNGRLQLLNKVIGGEYQDNNDYVRQLKLFSTMTFLSNPDNFGVIKIPHLKPDSELQKKSDERIKREIEVIKNVKHSNLVNILDHDSEYKWYVSQYYSQGTLINNIGKYRGNLLKSLLAFRPLVEAVAMIHEKGFVHRDITPLNIFLDSRDNLILGDFGLVYINDEEHNRLSGAYENVGSRDWMAPWNQGKFTDEIKPASDVFSLGKVLWSMISGKHILQLWYFSKPENDLVALFPNIPSIKLVNGLFAKCIVEEEMKCLQNATELLKEINKLILAINLGGDSFSSYPLPKCKVCGIGDYEMLLISNNPSDANNFGFNPRGFHTFDIYRCKHCAHIQLFYFDGPNKKFEAWPDR